MFPRSLLALFLLANMACLVFNALVYSRPTGTPGPSRRWAATGMAVATIGAIFTVAAMLG